jgi:hypothetical protein
MSPITNRSVKDVCGISSKRRHTNHEQSSPQVYVTAFAAITIVATCLMSSTLAFTSSSSRSSLDNRIHSSPFTFGIQSSRSPPLISSTSLFAGGSKSDKEEWRAILAAFQMYKAAYGDLKVPTRFVVPSMAPWPGKCLLFMKVTDVCDYFMFSHFA